LLFHAERRYFGEALWFHESHFSRDVSGPTPIVDVGFLTRPDLDGILRQEFDRRLES
jgi:hypothetical protein